MSKENDSTIIYPDLFLLNNKIGNFYTGHVLGLGYAFVQRLPYDVEPNIWANYVSLCGEIDAEISVPELVKAKNLCPHQDYIYFNYPTEY